MPTENIRFIGAQAGPGAFWVSDKDINYHLLFAGSSGRPKSFLFPDEHAQALWDRQFPKRRPRRERYDMTPHRVDEYLSLPEHLYQDAASQINGAANFTLRDEVIARILSSSRIGARILNFDEVETQIREELWEAVGEFFTGSRPPRFESNADFEAYQLLLRARARARGYLSAD